MGKRLADIVAANEISVAVGWAALSLLVTSIEADDTVG